MIDVMVETLHSDVRSKPEDEKKGKYSLSLGKDTYAALVKAAEKEHRTVSAMADVLLRKSLGLNKDDEGEV